MDYKCNDTKFKAMFGDITELDVDVMAVASSPNLLMNGGIALKIKEKGGKEIEDEAVSKGKGKPGQVIITDCGCLPAKKIFHCVLLNEENVANPSTLKKCVKYTLDKAVEEGYKKIAFPALGSAFKGLSPKLSTDIIVAECKKAAMESDSFDEFIFVVCDQTPYRYYKKALKSQLK